MASPAFSWSRQRVGRTEVRAGECLVVAARRETAEAGLAVLDEGGNAVDAAVAMAFTAAVTEPSEATVAGTGFLLLHNPPCDQAWSVEFPPRAPRAARPDMFDAGDANTAGPLAPCVPGAVAGLCLAHERFGTLPLARLLEPAIELAEAGVAVDEYLALRTLEHLPALRASPGPFLTDGMPPVPPFAADTPPPLIRRPALAQTLRAVAASGPDGFYRGDTAETITQAFADAGGLIDREDLEAYRASVVRPLARSYRGTVVLSPRAPCGGWTVLQALRRLEQTEPPAPGSVEAFHRIAEALRAAFDERWRLAGDVGHGTTHLCAIDADGRTVSCTLTAGLPFGSGFSAAGVLFDSGMAWFDPRPGTPNSIAPGKRPLVNMAPVLVLSDGRARLAAGAAGGRRIPSAVVELLVNVLDYDMTPQEAIDAPRIDASEPELRLSDLAPPGTAERLRELGHDVLEVAIEHAPFSYELARPAAAGIGADGMRSGGIHAATTGFVAGR